MTRDGDLFVFVVAGRALGFVHVVEGDRDGGFGDARVAAFVDELLEMGRAHLGEIADAQYEADRVEYVGLARAVEAGYGVEVRVEWTHDRGLGVGFESFDYDLFYVHFGCCCM